MVSPGPFLLVEEEGRPLLSKKDCSPGDFSEEISDSEALRDFIIECNRGNDIFFLSDLAELETRIPRLS